jgi:hypothetical protein
MDQLQNLSLANKLIYTANLLFDILGIYLFTVLVVATIKHKYTGTIPSILEKLTFTVFVPHFPIGNCTAIATSSLASMASAVCFPS